ncbi:MAG: hypothetical protein OXP70_04360 [Acidobacteriota bacterium]|nr:hypothetical protein [Acidobacteriota bacterium]
MEIDAVDVSDPEPKAPQTPVGQILTHEGRSIAVVDLGSTASDALNALLRRVGEIRQMDHAVRARMAEWINAFDVAADEAREHAIVVFRQPDGERALRAVCTRNVRLEKAA